MKIFKLKSGFTFLEVMMVISIIIILVMIILPSFRGLQTNAKIDEARWKLEVLKSAVESYYRHHIDLPQPYPEDIHTKLQTTRPRIVKEIVKDPFETFETTDPKTFGYELHQPSNKAYVIYSWGPDKTKSWEWSLDTIGQPVEVRILEDSDDIVVSNIPVRKL